MYAKKSGEWRGEVVMILLEGAAALPQDSTFHQKANLGFDCADNTNLQSKFNPTVISFLAINN